MDALEHWRSARHPDDLREFDELLIGAQQRGESARPASTATMQGCLRLDDAPPLAHPSPGGRLRPLAEGIRQAM